ncbi:MAG: homoserine kinase [Chloroflexota bacterium]|nr:homoserine kinase [Chloroflexota bacterium]
MRFTVRAPASTANLGPGFDALGLALDLWNEVTIDTEGTPGKVVNHGSEAALLEGRENLTVTAMRTLAKEFDRELPPFQVTADTNIPIARGLGSSAAALVAGLVAANHLLDLGLDRDALFARAWETEGHGDNVGAAMFGGAVLSVPGVHRIIPLWREGAPRFSTVVFIPEATGATWAARAALPNEVPHADATFNLARAAGLTLGLQQGDRELIAAGMHDRLHEPYRARLFPHLDEMKHAAVEAGAWGAALSGAGPSVIALVPTDRVGSVDAAYREVARRLGTEGRTAELTPVCTGVHLQEIPVTHR